MAFAVDSDLDCRMETLMPLKPDSILPDAKELMKRLALAEAKESDKEAKTHARAEAEKKSFIDFLKKPSGISDAEGIKRAVQIIERAANSGKSEVCVLRFSNKLCTDRGRAINQREPGWERTLTGVPKEIHELWVKYFRDKGYKLRVEIIDFPDELPGDIAMTLSWT
jgi:hypothetical protein